MNYKDFGLGVQGVRLFFNIRWCVRVYEGGIHKSCDVPWKLFTALLWPLCRIVALYLLCLGFEKAFFEASQEFV